jgi:hypothetical protein
MKNIMKILWLIMLIFFNELYGQDSKYKKIIINDYISDIRSRDIELKDSINYKNVLNIWDQFLYSNNRPDFAENNWSKEEKLFFGQPDYSYRFIDKSPIYGELKTYNPLIISVRKIDSSLYEIKTMFYSIDDMSRIKTSSIRDVYVIKEDGKWVLQSALYRNMKKLRNKVVGYLTYWFEEGFDFNVQRAKLFNEENKKLADIYNVLPYKVNYIVTNSKIEYLKICGYSFHPEMALNDYSSAVSFDGLKMILSGNGREDYFHELVHIYTGYKSINCHYIFNEGVSTYLGGSRGFNLDYHLSVLYHYTRDNKVDFNDRYFLRKRIDKTNVDYAIGGLFCKIMYDREGINGIFKLLKPGSAEEDYRQIVEQVVGIKREDLNSFIQNELKKYE